MKRTEYFDYLNRTLRRHFDLEFKKTFPNFQVDLYGKFIQRNARYLVSKQLEFYAFKNNEYLFYKDFDEKITVKDIEAIRIFLEQEVDSLVKTDEEHMESIFTFVYSCDFPLDDDVIKAIKKFKFYKSYKLGFEGWVNTKLLVLDPETNEYITNRFGKRSEKNFIPQE